MRKALIVLAAFFCAACSNYSANLPSIKPYKMDIQQGNHVTSKMMMQLRPGMTKSQVRFVMGTPLIADTFHADRWDYLYRMVKDGKIIEQRHVILEFENDQLKRVRGDVIPAGATEAPVVDTRDKAAPKPVPAPKQKEKGLLDKLKFWKDDEAPIPAAPQPQPSNEPLKAPAPVVSPAEKPKAAETPAPVAPESKQPAEAESAPASQPTAVPARQPAAEPVSQQSASEASKVAPAKPEPSKVAPQQESIPAEDLPPEDDPGYFERMLEKIGF